MTAQDQTHPAGTEALDAMEGAERYHAYIVGEIEAAFEGHGERVAEIGAGTGTVSRLLSREGRELVCVEPDDAARARLEASGLRALASLDDLQAGSLQAALMVNVLEHIADDVAVLRELRSRLIDGGRLFIWVPAGDWLYSSFDASVGHVRRYSKGNLRRTIEHAGFEVLELRYTDPLGALAAGVYKLGPSGRGAGELSPRSVELYDRYAFGLSRRLQAVCGRFFGKNLLAVAHARPSGRDNQV